jgi:phosphoribosylpyrophosphate synthetase
MEELDVAQCWLTLILSPHTMGPKRVTAVSKKLQTAIFARSKKRAHDQINHACISDINP